MGLACIALAILPSTPAVADGTKTLTVTQSSDGAVVATATDASGAPVSGLSLTMLARSQTGSIVGPRQLAADAEHPGHYATGPSALPEGSWVVTVSDGGQLRTTTTLTSSGPPPVAKPNPRHPSPTRTTAGNLAAEDSSRSHTLLGVAAIVLGLGVVAAIAFASRSRSGPRRSARIGRSRR
ncbi:hypothetical protein OG799_11800 [Micromonospora sp. NBC_00898]|uniref:hypothetical protein n=1 Tax=Micromonospora sp. NBC_00898 TaxID=2975981 RepID=UPI003869A8A0|nr:hypothetical protein OG799_11800 [Micromonospora sp. NBC_00898]